MKHKGFTLVELMVTIAILSVLLAIAIPNYNAHILNVGREDAISTLNGEAQRLDRCFSDRDTVAGCVDFDPPIPSYQGNYQISANLNNVNGAIYTLTATAVGNQADDIQCVTLTINSLGTRTAQDSDGNDTTNTCWE